MADHELKTDLIGRADIFRALSDPVRLDLFARIVTSEEASCTALVAEANVTASTVSYHVKILKNAGLVAVRKAGRNYFYTARRAELIELAGALNRLAVSTQGRAPADQRAS